MAIKSTFNVSKTPPDSIPMTTKCWVCCRRAVHDLLWTGEICRKCGKYYNLEFTWPDIVTARRELLRLNRKQMALLTGYSPKTIKQYEWVKCSEQYYHVTEELIKKYNRNKLKLN